MRVERAEAPRARVLVFGRADRCKSAPSPALLHTREIKESWTEESCVADKSRHQENLQHPPTRKSCRSNPPGTSPSHPRRPPARNARQVGEHAKRHYRTPKSHLGLFQRPTTARQTSTVDGSQPRGAQSKFRHEPAYPKVPRRIFPSPPVKGARAAGVGRPFSRFGLARDSDGGLGLRAKGEQARRIRTLLPQRSHPRTVWALGCGLQSARAEGMDKNKGHDSYSHGRVIL